MHAVRPTFGQRLREVTQRYATATVARLLEAAIKVLETRDRTTLPRVVDG